MNRLIQTAMLGTLFGAAVAANAADTTTFEVKIVITESCNISTTTNVDFGSNARSSTVSEAVGALNVNCTPGTPYTIALDGGSFPDGNGTRRMTKGTDTILYGLYKSTGTTDPWTSASPLSGSGNGNNQALSIYGNLVSGASNAPAGTYLDTVTATVTY